MRYTFLDKQKDLIILLARVLLMVLFITSGWGKLTHFGGTADYMASLGAPAPQLAAAIATFMEFFVGIALVVGFFVRPLAVLMGLFVVGTALIGHAFWSMPDPAAAAANQLQFFKNMSIFGGLLLLSVTGAGKYSVDGR